jgi:hypothetical protein
MVKRSTLRNRFGIIRSYIKRRAKENDMVVVKLSWDLSVVVSKEDALAFIDILERAEKYEDKYVSGGDNTKHVYPMDKTFGMEVMPTELYQMAKLAGKPVKE